MFNQYTGGQLNGWRPELVDEAKARFGHLFNPLSTYIPASDEKIKIMLYDVVRKLFNKDLPNVPQEIGDCVSHGAKHGTEYLECCEILLGGELQVYKSVYAPYYYGTSRCLVGGVHDRRDGSTGTWMAKAVMEYGTLFEDEEGVQPYSGKIAKDWGYRGPPEQYVEVAKKYLIKKAALITSWEEFVSSLKNGYPVPTASSIGYNMKASADGFHKQTDKWNHQMCFIGVDQTYSEEYAILLNNWGDVHGQLTDFQTGDKLPVGVLRVRKKDVLKHIAAGETYAYSAFDGFPERPLEKALFRPF